MKDLYGCEGRERDWEGDLSTDTQACLQPE